MAACALTLTGMIAVGGPGCCGSSGESQKIQPLSFGCPNTLYQAIASTDCPVAIATPGTPGQAFIPCPGTQDLASVSLLLVKASQPVLLRIGAAPATLQGASGTFPTSFAGGETFTFKADTITVATTFTSGAQSAAQVAVQINQAAVAAGLDYLPASVSSNGQLKLTGEKTGKDGSLQVTVANATIGFPTLLTTLGAGTDQTVRTLLAEFDPSSSPGAILISGNARVEILAAGTPA